MRQPLRRPAFITTALILLTTFVVTAALTAAGIYLILGREGVLGGGGLILLLVPPVVAISVTQVVGRFIRPTRNPLLSWAFQKIARTPVAQVYYKRFLSHGLYACLKCFHVGVGTPPEKCPKCGERIEAPTDTPAPPAAGGAIPDQAEPAGESRATTRRIDIPEPRVRSVEEQFANQPTAFNDPSR